MNDFLSIYFIALIIITAIPVVIYSFGYLEEYKTGYSIKYFWVIMMIFLISMAGVVLSVNGISFIVFWELMSLSSFFLVIFEYKKSENIESGIMYFIMTHISGLFIMIMFILISRYTGISDFRIAAGCMNKLDYMHINIILILALLGFGAKAGLVPLHAWLPKAHPSAPSNVSALMSGIMLKIALYGFIRVCFIFTNNTPVWFGILVLTAGTLTALFGILNALFQNDIKKLLAFSSIENVGLIFGTLGLALVLRSFGNDLLSNIALTAALFHILNHAVFKSLLFMGAGSVLFAASTKNMNELGGLYKKMRLVAGCTFIGIMGIGAIPPLNGFASEILILGSFIQGLSVIKNPAVSLVIIFCGIILALTSGGVVWAFVKCFGTTFLGEPRSKKAVDLKEIPKSMNAGMMVLAFLTVVLGVFSPILINYIFKGISNDWNINIASFEITVAALLFFIVTALIFIYTRKILKGSTAVQETWGCGFNNFKPYIQYSPEGFVQPAIRMFGSIVSYKKEVKIKDTVYVKGRIGDIVESNIYFRVTSFFDFIASRVIKIHYGKIQIYVSYIFISLIISIILVIKFV
ncbi:MAG: proton-conducting transporter membrane subunit [Solirubrobacterales bacterium]